VLRLTEQERELVELRHVKGVSIYEIARQRGVFPQSIRSILVRARKKMRANGTPIPQPPKVESIIHFGDADLKSIELRVAHTLTKPEIARRLGCSFQTVERVLDRYKRASKRA
jgi:DNA-directed RNA polymerase specialized sigma24 family protein